MSNDILLARHDQDIGIITHMMLKRGADLTFIQDTQAYKGVADTFSEYLSQNDVRKDAMFCIDLFNFYCKRHKQHIEDVHDLHHLRLAEIMKKLPDISTNELEEWLHKLRNLSWKDVINAVREARGRAEMPQSKSTLDEPPDSGSLFCNGTPYDKEYVKTLPCLECLAPPPSEPHHWPRTKARDGKFMIPLCNKHHGIAQSLGPHTWFSKGNNWRAIANYLDRHVNSLGGK
jgi:hypothetical protein